MQGPIFLESDKTFLINGTEEEEIRITTTTTTTLTATRFPSPMTICLLFDSHDFEQRQRRQQRRQRQQWWRRHCALKWTDLILKNVTNEDSFLLQIPWTVTTTQIMNADATYNKELVLSSIKHLDDPLLNVLRTDLPFVLALLNFRCFKLHK